MNVRALQLIPLYAFVDILYIPKLRYHYYLLSSMVSFISIISLSIALAVSIPPAPRPIIVCSPECSDEKVPAFNVPLTHNGSILDTSIGFTLRFLLSHVAISFMALPLLWA